MIAEPTQRAPDDTGFLNLTYVLLLALLAPIWALGMVVYASMDLVGRIPIIGGILGIIAMILTIPLYPFMMAFACVADRLHDASIILYGDTITVCRTPRPILAPRTRDVMQFTWDDVSKFHFVFDPPMQRPEIVLHSGVTIRQDLSTSWKHVIAEATRRGMHDPEDPKTG